MNTFLNLLVLSYTLQGGLVHHNNSLYGMVNNYDAIFSSVELKLHYENFYVSSTNLVDFDKAQNGPWFQPLTEEYTIAGGYTLGGFSIFASHMCRHPIVTIGADNNQTGLWAGSEDRLTIEYKGRF